MAEWVPTGKLVVETVARPVAGLMGAGKPICVEPSKNFTEPLGWPMEPAVAAVTMAEKVTA